jgi:hypothetical protein
MALASSNSALAQPASSASAATPPSLSGLWAISNRSMRGPLDQNMKPIQGETLTAEGAARKKAARPGFDPSALCLPALPRHLTGPYPIQIVQEPGIVVTLFEWNTIFRVVYLDGRPHPDPLVETRWMGHSVGRWEGDVLVVETTNFNGKGWLTGDGVAVSDKARLTEWISRAADGKTLQIKTRLEDPDHLVQPIWSNLVFNLKKDWELKEYICGEGNRDNVLQPQADNPGSLEIDDKFGSK